MCRRNAARAKQVIEQMREVMASSMRATDSPGALMRLTARFYNSGTCRETLRRKKSPRCDSRSFVIARFKRGLIRSLARREIAGLQQ